MSKVVINKLAEQKIQSGIQLLDQRDLQGKPLSDGLVDLFSASSIYLGQAYLSPQNKGVGWVLPQPVDVFDEAYFAQLFSAAKEKRQSYQHSDVTTAYRLFNQDGDDFGGLTIDRYGDFALVTWYNAFVYSLRQPILAALRAVYPDVIGGYGKCRFDGAPQVSTHLYGQEAPAIFTILENSVRYSVFLNDGLMTGLFLDQHEVRGRLVAGLAKGKTVLNMFSYTAGFSVASAVGGARETTSVDLAKRSRELSQAHFEANHLDTTNHRFVVMDVFEYFKYALKKGLTYDIIILDPPSFARNKKQTFSVAKDYYRLVNQALSLLTDGGLLICSTNASTLTLTAFRQQLQKGLEGISAQEIYLDRLPNDFAHNPADETSNYLKVITLKVAK